MRASVAPSSETPIPVGLDAYRQWEQWPLQRIGVRTYLRSTYDRAGGNEGADASHFLYQEADDFNVSLDVEGAGILYFVRTNHWHGSPWHFVVDGADHVVRETATADPNRPPPDSEFEPPGIFPRPLAWTWAVTKGADLMWVPLGFEQSFRMAYSRTRYGTGYYIYQKYIPGTPLSQPIKAWKGEAFAGDDVLALIGKAGTDLVAQADTAAGRAAGILAATGEPLRLGKAATVTVRDLVAASPMQLRALEFSVPRDQAIAFGRARLRITWDDRREPSIDAPVALFFGAGTLYNRDDHEYLVKAFPVAIRYEAARVRLACYFPMPFFRRARIELTGNGRDDLTDIRASVRYQPLKLAPTQVGYFHATYRDHLQPERGQDLVLLDTRQEEGGGDWSGSFVGTSFIFSDRGGLRALEGDPRFFFDDSQTPQAQGTGSEEWGGGGDYWGGENMTLPFAGHPVGAKNPLAAKNEEDKIQSAYRFLLADLMPFGRNAVIRLEHGGTNESDEHYRTVTYWYGRPGATLVKTDTLQVGDAASEKAHRYVSPTASPPYEISSRYELGVDHLPAVETPRAEPADYAEFEFEAKAGQAYVIWVRGRSPSGPAEPTASFWMQFDQEVGTTRLAGSYGHPNGFGNWVDAPGEKYSWTSVRPPEEPRSVTFAQDGRHRLRVQTRRGAPALEQIWLSSTQTSVPAPAHAPMAQRDREIVLAASEAKRQGRVSEVADPASLRGTVLELAGESTAPTATVEIYPAHLDRGRKTTGSSEFTFAVRPDNVGVLLRRKLDYAFPNQRARVFVATGESPAPEWQPAGIWYLAGSNTCVYSNPKEELGATQHAAQTSNRRFRDDEFLLPRELTRGRSSLRVRVDFLAVDRPLFPGHPVGELAWSEIRYDAYCFVMPSP